MYDGATYSFMRILGLDGAATIVRVAGYGD